MYYVLSTAQSVEIMAAASDITVDPITDLVIRVVGSLFVAVLVWRLFKHWATTAWGMIAIEIVAALFVSIFVVDPDAGMALLDSIRSEVVPSA